jgi:homotetrameric cytidine deaminase
MDTAKLVAAAVAARPHAYAPYSRFQVGAALLLADGRVLTGVNVENASYGLAVCAERNAVAAAVLAGLHRGDLRAVAVAADSDGPVSPCGACRQVLAEFAPPGTPVLLHNVRDGSTVEHSIAELLPHAFAPERLP